MRTPVVLLLLMACCHVITGQNPCTTLNYHSFKCESLTGTYEDLGDQGTEIEVSDLDDGISDPQEIGFTFEYNCQSFTQFILNTNGFIKLGTETTPKTNLFFSNAQSVNGGVFSDADSNNVNLLVAFNHDIEEGVGEPDFRVHTTGSAPYRVCTIQWENMREWTYEPEKQYDNMDFQIKLYETTNIIEFVYGEWDPSTNISNYKTAACGLKGSSPDDSQLLVVVKSSSADWDNVTFHNGNYAPNESFNFGNPPDRPKPDAGRTYRFTPTFDQDLSVLEGYALGEASRYYASPQEISALVRNSGFTTQTNIPVYLDISQANTYADTQYIAQLAFGESARVTFSDFAPQQTGISEIRIIVPDDELAIDNGKYIVQHTTDTETGYASEGPSTGDYGFLSGAQGICYARYPIHGTAEIDAVRVFISSDTLALGQTVFANVLNGEGVEVARSTDLILESQHLNTWHEFVFAAPPVIMDEEVYAGFGMRVSATEYHALGVQVEKPIRPGAFYTSFISGAGLKEVDPAVQQDRFMIGLKLRGTTPVGGVATGDAMICHGDQAMLSLEGYSGFIQWETSADGVSGWIPVSGGMGAQSDFFTTDPLTEPAYFRAEVFQPGNGSAYSNPLLVDVIPHTPVITSSGDVLLSSAATGNQWYDADGPIPGATDPIFLATAPGVYYVVVTEGDCVSAPSNQVELLTVGVDAAISNRFMQVYPNPFKNELYFKFTDPATGGNWRLLNLQGNIMAEGKLTAQGMVNLDHLSNGPYLFVCWYEDKFLVKQILKMDD